MDWKMNWKKWAVRTVSYILVAVLASASTLFLWASRQKIDKLTELQMLIEQYFVGDVDMEKVLDTAAHGMIYALGDQWSYYIPASEVGVHQEYKDNSTVGVGVNIALREDEIGMDILGVTIGSPAESAGILPGDVLTKVDGKPIGGMTLDQITSLVRGEEDTELTLALVRDGAEMTVTLKRQKLVVAAGKMLEGNIGLVRINNFNSDCAAQTLAAIEQLCEEGATKLIFDVRNNPGGYVSEMLKVLDHLLPEGVLFRQEDHLGNKTEETSDEACLDMPMAVLVNEDSYSAAEFFAAALQEYEWATVVGEKTCGKGYYQYTLMLSDGSAVNLSAGKYSTPNGVNLTEVGGLIPNVTVELDEEMAEKLAVNGLSVENDPQIQAAVAALTGK